MKRYINDPKNDILFKYIFGKDNEQSKRLLRVIIEEVTDLKVKELTILNPDLSPEHLEEKDLILDIRVRDENGNICDIEMQCYGPSKIYIRRFAQYGYKLAGNLYHEGETFLEDRKVYQILFINSINPKLDELIRVLKMRDNNNQEDEGGNLLVKAYIYIKEAKEYDPSNFFKSLVYLFNHPEESDILRERNEMISMVADKINEFNEDEELADLAFRRKLNQIYKNSLEKEAEEAEEVKKQMKKTREQLEAAKEQLEAAKEQLEAAKEQLEAAKAQAEAVKAQAEAVKAQAKDAKAQGEMIGEAGMLKKINLLNQKLKEENRIEDLLKSSTDLEYQNQLMKEYRLE